MGLLPRLALASIGVGPCRLIGRTIDALLFLMKLVELLGLVVLRE